MLSRVALSSAKKGCLAPAAIAAARRAFTIKPRTVIKPRTPRQPKKLGAKRAAQEAQESALQEVQQQQPPQVPQQQQQQAPYNPFLQSPQDQPPQTFGTVMKQSLVMGFGMALAFSAVRLFLG